MEQESLKMHVDSEGVVTWSQPRSSAPFMLNLFGITSDQLFRDAGPNEKGEEIANCKSGEDKTVKVEAGGYHIVGGDFVNTTYINSITVDENGQITEKKLIVNEVIPSFDPNQN